MLRARHPALGGGATRSGRRSEYEAAGAEAELRKRRRAKPATPEKKCGLYIKGKIRIIIQAVDFSY